MREQAGLADAERVGDLAERQPVEAGHGGEQERLLQHRAAGPLPADESAVLRHDSQPTKRPTVRKYKSGHTVRSSMWDSSPAQLPVQEKETQLNRHTESGAGGAAAHHFPHLL
ncbi:hypothetical protein Ait01nite_099290 [Actinoplanes italicus]|nr:hypothetical protein Ait01nite_099290 [Actinoplanes italicus]